MTDTSDLKLEEVKIIGENAHYRFCIGRCRDRWIGFAVGGSMSLKAHDAFHSEGIPTGPNFMFVFPEVSEGFVLGLLERDKAILLTGAVAQDPESAYGGVDRWLVPECQRGDPEAFRCRSCDRVGCNDADCASGYVDFWGDMGGES